MYLLFPLCYYSFYPKLSRQTQQIVFVPPSCRHLHLHLHLLYSPTSHHPTTRVYSLIIISFLVSPSSLILFEVLQPLLCLRCTSSLERTPKRPPSLCTLSKPSS